MGTAAVRMMALGQREVRVVRPRSFTSRDGGQSLVEISLALPLLLVMLLGLVDVGRAFMVTSAVTNAAREAAIYAAKTSDATLAQVTQRACDETGFASYGSACGSELTVTCSACPSNGSDVTVTVTYRVDLVSGYLFGRLLGRDSLTARGVASFPGLVGQ